MSAPVLDEQALLLKDEAAWYEWYDSLYPDERTLLINSVKNDRRVAPNPGPQTDAYFCEADVLGYGGSAGGGKTGLAAMLSLFEHTRSIVFRKDATQLSGFVDDLIVFYGSSTGLNRQSHVFRFPDRPGHMVEWGGLGDPREWENYQGRAHDLIVIDEATQVAQAGFEYVKNWLRTVVPGQRCRCVLTFNPPGGPNDEAGGASRWVIDYFAPWIDERHPNPAAPGELRYFGLDPENPETGKIVELPNGEPYEIRIEIPGNEPYIKVVEPESRTFIPARVWDNPHINKEYERNLLSQSDPVLRRQLLFGDFRSGIMDGEWQVIPTAWVDQAMERWDESGRRQAMTAMGVDVARGGRDFTVLSPRHGFWWDTLRRVPGINTKDGSTVASLVIKHLRDRAEIDIDIVGVGSSPHDFLKRAGANVVAVNGSVQKGLPKIDPIMEFANLRALLYWLMRMVLNPDNNLQPALPPDNKLRAELIAHNYDTQTGKIRVERKDEIKKRLHYSPDDADAVIYTLMNILTNTSGAERLSGRNKVDIEKIKRELYGTQERGPRLSISGRETASWMGR